MILSRFLFNTLNCTSRLKQIELWVWNAANWPAEIFSMKFYRSF